MCRLRLWAGFFPTARAGFLCSPRSAKISTVCCLAAVSAAADTPAPVLRYVVAAAAIVVVLAGFWFTRPGDDVIGFDENGDPIIDARVNPDTNPTRTTDPNENYSIPQSMAYNIAEFETERTNAQLVLQWAPTENFTTTLDYIRSEFDLERSYSDLSAWFNNTAALSQESEWTDGPIATPIYYYEEKNFADFAMGTGHVRRI